MPILDWINPYWSRIPVPQNSASYTLSQTPGEGPGNYTLIRTDSDGTTKVLGGNFTDLEAAHAAAQTDCDQTILL
jgi:hypothetical protein